MLLFAETIFFLQIVKLTEAQKQEKTNPLQKKFEIQDKFLFDEESTSSYITYIRYIEAVKSLYATCFNEQESNKPLTESLAPEHSTRSNQNSKISKMLEQIRKQEIKERLYKYYMHLIKNDLFVSIIEEHFGMELNKISFILAFSNLLQRRINSANERNRKNNTDADCEQNKKSLFGDINEQNEKITEFLVSYIYVRIYDAKKLPQLLFDYMLDKKIENESKATNRINNDLIDLVTRDSKNKRAKIEKLVIYNGNSAKKHEDSNQKIDTIFKKYNDKSDCITNHLLFKKLYTELMEQLLQMLRGKPSLHNILKQNNEELIAEYAKNESLYLMLFLRNCILAAKHEVLQKETIIFYEQTLHNYIIVCKINKSECAKTDHKTFLNQLFHNQSKELLRIHQNWRSKQRKLNK